MSKIVNILDEIIAFKKHEVQEKKKLTPVNSLEQSMYFKKATNSLSNCLQRKDKSGIIAEIKRKSPSKGIIHPDVSVAKLSAEYIAAGASALSVLTDENYFGGSNQDLLIARKQIANPILRKEFIIDEYQVVEAKSIGADVILLIVACLDKKTLKSLTGLAHDLDMEVLIEVHDKSEIYDDLFELGDIIGINNRDLETFDVNIETSRILAELIPEGITLISESGLHAPEQLIDLKSHGFNGFLIGENFMRQTNPSKACRNFIEKLEILEKKQNENALH